MTRKPTTALFDLTASEAASLVRSRSLSPVDLMEALLARSEALEPALCVWASLDPDSAMAQARDAERRLESGRPIGPLHGVPVGVKDIFYVEGVTNEAGSPILADFVPDYDSTPVSLLRAAGAVIMGKTVTTEFALGDPPPTRNPWNADHTPGGSSSGSAVGVAAQLFPAALGSQTAGSVIRPASFNGVVGMKPTFSRISRRGVVPVSCSLDTVGFFTRSVEDAALLLGVLAGHDVDDPSSSASPVPDYLYGLGEASPPRIGLVRWYFLETCSGEAKAATLDAVDRLVAAGAEVEEVEIDFDADQALEAHRILMAVETASVHRSTFQRRPDDYSPFVRSVIEAGLLTSAVLYVQAQRVRREFCRAVGKALEGFDLLLTTAADAPAPPRSLATTGNPTYQAPWTMAGVPVIALPCGLSPEGLPLGVQLVGRPFAEEGLLSAARWSEAALDFRLSPEMQPE